MRIRNAQQHAAMLELDAKSAGEQQRVYDLLAAQKETEPPPAWIEDKTAGQIRNMAVVLPGFPPEEALRIMVKALVLHSAADGLQIRRIAHSRIDDKFVIYVLLLPPEAAVAA